MTKRLNCHGGRFGRTRPRMTAIMVAGTFLILSVVLGLVACQPDSDGVESVAEVDSQEQAVSSTSDSSETATEAIPENAEDESGAETEINQPPPDPDALWSSSNHANSFVMGDDGTNIKCARCHAPIQWVPTMDDIPESCLTCKFEIEPPPPVVAEAEWEHVPCQVCHKVKKDEVKPEYMWLEIAQIEEYAEVASTTELCMKCHEAVDLPAHEEILFTDVHQDLTCTECHDAHSTTSGCSTPGCHEDALSPAEPIPGHDDNHALVSCVACHDAAGLEVGPDDEQGTWTTFPVAGGADPLTPIVSHQLQLGVECDRCHYAGNPWGLSDSVSSEP